MREYFEYDNRSNITLRSRWPKDVPDPDGWTPSDPAIKACCRPMSPAPLPAGAQTWRETFLPDAGVTNQYGTVMALGCGDPSQDFRLCDKPLTQTDPRGATTTFTYDRAHGGVLTATGPTVNGVAPQTWYTYVQRQAWLAQPGGGFAPTGQPIWLLATKSSCRTGAAADSGTACADPADEVRTVYEYGAEGGPNNLLLRGIVEDATGRALRTCYAYDWQGNKISETKPRAGVTSCL